MNRSLSLKDMKKFRHIISIILFLAMMPVYALSEPVKKPEAPKTAAPQRLSDNSSVTEHEMIIGGRRIAYKATAAYLPLKDEMGKEKANFFFVAYEKLGRAAAPGKQRPITFFFNGGPGAAAVWLHMGMAGPWRIKPGDALGSVPAPPFGMMENEATWLDLTDLVFIDPVGTGYSRAAGEEKPEKFYGLIPDVEAAAEFIRLYITHAQRWFSPKFLVGESYGATRAAVLSDHLINRYGIALNGLVLISGVLNYQTILPGPGNDLAYALYLPSYTAAAWHHKRLTPDLQKDLSLALKEVENFALGDYLLALAKGALLPTEQRQALSRKLEKYTGLPAAVYEKNDLRIGPERFLKLLLEDRRLLIGRFDTRLTGTDPDVHGQFPRYDPSLSGFIAAYSSIFNDYVRSVLHFESDLPYEVLSDRVRPWKYDKEEHRHGYLNVGSDLSAAMAKLPALKALILSGYFDLAVPYLSADYTVSHIEAGAMLRPNMVVKHYPAGHMLYHHAKTRLKLKEDFKAFLEMALQ